MFDRRKAHHLGGESLREMGILMLVFVPLDALFQRERPSVITVAAFIAAGLLFAVGGIIIQANE